MTRYTFKLQKLFQMHGVTLADMVDLPLATVHRLLLNQKLTMPLKLMNTIDTIIEQDRAKNTSVDPSLFLPENTDRELIYAAMSKGISASQTLETHAWHLFSARPKLNGNKWEGDNKNFITLHTIPRDTRGYDCALFRRTELGWERALDEVETTTVSKQNKWK